MFISCICWFSKTTKTNNAWCCWPLWSMLKRCSCLTLSYLSFRSQETAKAIKLAKISILTLVDSFTTWEMATTCCVALIESSFFIQLNISRLLLWEMGFYFLRVCDVYSFQDIFLVKKEKKFLRNFFFWLNAKVFIKIFLSWGKACCKAIPL